MNKHKLKWRERATKSFIVYELYRDEECIAKIHRYNPINIHLQFRGKEVGRFSSPYWAMKAFKSYYISEQVRETGMFVDVEISRE